MSNDTKSGPNFVQDLRDAAARNPVSAALIGMGVLWMLTGARTPAGPQNAFRSAGLGRVPVALDNARSGLMESVDTVKDAATSTIAAVREHSAAAVDNVANYGSTASDAVFGTARDGLTALFRSQPLAIGAIGLAIGAGVAAALPKTDPEDAYLGEISQTVRNQAAELVGQHVQKATALASDVVDAVSAEARNQGLTPGEAKATISDISGRVGRVVDAAKNSIGER